MPDTRVVDDPKSYKHIKAEAAVVFAMVGTPSFVSAELSLVKSTNKKKSSESEGALTVSLPTDGSAYSDSSFVKDLSEVLFLPADRKRLTDIGPVQSVEWSMAHIY